MAYRPKPADPGDNLPASSDPWPAHRHGAVLGGDLLARDVVPPHVGQPPADRLQPVAAEVVQAHVGPAVLELAGGRVGGGRLRGVQLCTEGARRGQGGWEGWDSSSGEHADKQKPAKLPGRLAAPLPLAAGTVIRAPCLCMPHTRSAMPTNNRAAANHWPPTPASPHPSTRRPPALRRGAQTRPPSPRGTPWPPRARLEVGEGASGLMMLAGETAGTNGRQTTRGAGRWQSLGRCTSPPTRPSPMGAHRTRCRASGRSRPRWGPPGAPVVGRRQGAC